MLHEFEGARPGVGGDGVIDVSFLCPSLLRATHGMLGPEPVPATILQRLGRYFFSVFLCRLYFLAILQITILLLSAFVIRMAHCPAFGHRVDNLEPHVLTLVCRNDLLALESPLAIISYIRIGSAAV